jgi:pilus assembly protein Flp/PilA
MSMITLLKQFHNDEDGQGLTEYLLVVGLIALAAIAAMQGVATKIQSAFNTLGSKIGAATT